VTYHASRLKDILAVFLPRDNNNKQNSAENAVYDISVIASTAWDVSTKALQAPLQFGFAFHDVNSPFNAELHEPLDCITDPRQLQGEKCRIKLAVTPLIMASGSMLRGGSTATTPGSVKKSFFRKIITKGSVLVMKY
jgi:hypothetical protein